MRRTLRPILVLVVLGSALPSAPAHAALALGVSITLAPPPLPVYEQPPVPGPGYLWSPGYWAWSDGGDL